MNYPSHFAAILGKDFAELPVLRGVSHDILRETLMSAQPLHYRKGALIVAQGEDISRCYIVLEGWCGANKGNSEGQESILQLFRRGDFLFEAVSGMGEDVSAINLVALSPIRLLALSPGAVRLAQERSSTLTTNMLTAALRRNEELREHIEQLTLHTAEQRVGRFLLNLRFLQDPSGTDVALPFEKTSIASYLGIKPETLSRTFQILRKSGFSIGRTHVTLPSAQALCGYCDRGAMNACPFAASGDCPLSQKGVNTQTS